VSKVAILGDPHFGAKGASTILLDHQKKFYDFFFETIDDIDTVIILGDTFDTRKFTNNYILDQAKKIFFDKLLEKNIKVYVIIGNHDCYFRNTLTPNAVETLLAEYSNIIPISSPVTHSVKGIDICLIPWICNDNYEECYEEIRSSLSDICMGHFEIGGFQMYRGIESHGGLSSSIFNRFDMVFSGHYHHRSTNGNISYLGTPYELTWQDYGDPKGFHIFDLASRELQFIRNPNKLFVKIEYDDKGIEPINLDALDLSDSYVKLIVVNKTDYYKFDLFINKLYNKKCIEIKIIEDIGDFSKGEISEEISLEDTQAVLDQYIESVETDMDKSKIKAFIASLYTEAINLEMA
jgi:DNA repair exonuclease SbcCD nuclease subunit